MTTTLRLQRLTWAGESVRIFELRTIDGSALPAWEAGAHVELQLPNGLVRSYSLLPAAPGDATRTDTYRLAIKRDPNSSGASRWLFARGQVGVELEVGEPRNHFPLRDGPAVLIGGGIGVTPLVAMAAALHARSESSWTLHYAVKRRDEAALLDELGRYGDRVRLHVDAEAGALIDVGAIIAEAPVAAALYCCGPIPLLEAFQSAARAAGRPQDEVHVEYFSAPAATDVDGKAVSGRSAVTEPFTVLLVRSGRQLSVPVGGTILSAMRAEGLSTVTACEQGTCGACIATVPGGTPDHHDVVLSAADRAAGHTMMICCSGSRTPELILDL